MREKSGYVMRALVTVLPALVLVALYILEFDTGHISHVDIRYGESDIYSDEEIEEAASVLKSYFFIHMPGYELRALSYQEEEAYPQLLAMDEAGMEARLGQAIIFESVYVKLYSYDGMEESNVEQSRKWVLVREGEAGKWKVDPSIRP